MSICLSTTSSCSRSLAGMASRSRLLPVESPKTGRCATSPSMLERERCRGMPQAPSPGRMR